MASNHNPICITLTKLTILTQGYTFVEPLDVSDTTPTKITATSPHTKLKRKFLLKKTTTILDLIGYKLAAFLNNKLPRLFEKPSNPTIDRQSPFDFINAISGLQVTVPNFKSTIAKQASSYYVCSQISKLYAVYSVQGLLAVGTVAAVGAGAVGGAILSQENDDQDRSIANNAAAISTNYDLLTGSGVQFWQYAIALGREIER